MQKVSDIQLLNKLITWLYIIFTLLLSLPTPSQNPHSNKQVTQADEKRKVTGNRGLASPFLTSLGPGPFPKL